MKKALSILLALTLALSLVACTSNQPSVDAEVDAPSVEDTLVETPEMEPEEDTETEEDVQAEEEPQVMTPEAQDAVEVPTTPATPDTTPAVPPVDELAPAAPGLFPGDEDGADMGVGGDVIPEGDVAVDSTISDSFFQAVLGAVAEFPAQMKVEGEFLTMTYPDLAGLSSDCAVYMPMISAVAGELAIAKTTDTAAVEALFQSRIDYQIAQGAFYPATILAWETNAKIVTVGDMVMLIVAPEGETAMVDTVVDLFNTTFA